MISHSLEVPPKNAKLTGHTHVIQNISSEIRSRQATLSRRIRFICVSLVRVVSPLGQALCFWQIRTLEEFASDAHVHFIQEDHIKGAQYYSGTRIWYVPSIHSLHA